MKTAFTLTDCSVDSALALRGWLVANPNEAIRLTVVHPYDIDLGAPLNKDTFRAAKQQAIARLEHWLDMLPQPWLGEFKPETLLASPELAIHMHLLLRSYDYLIVDDQIVGLPMGLEVLLAQTKTKLQRLAECSPILEVCH